MSCLQEHLLPTVFLLIQITNTTSYLQKQLLSRNLLTEVFFIMCCPMMKVNSKKGKALQI